MGPASILCIEHNRSPWCTEAPCHSLCDVESEERLRAQQELYESVRSERNSASRSLVEVQVRGGRGVWDQHVVSLLDHLQHLQRQHSHYYCNMAHLSSPTQDEVGELKRRLAVTAHQADQLKGEVAARDGELQREKYDKAKVGWCGMGLCSEG